jgi:hypothetical protein
VKSAVVCKAPPLSVTPLAAPRFVSLLMLTVPPATTVPPEYEFEPPSTNVPGPLKVKLRLLVDCPMLPDTLRIAPVVAVQVCELVIITFAETLALLFATKPVVSVSAKGPLPGEIV